MNRLALIGSLAALVTVAPARAAAQHDHETEGEEPRSHGSTFSTGPRDGWTLSAPHLDVNGGLFYVRTDPTETNEAFVRLHAQTALGIPYVQLSADVLWIPQFSATPTWSGVLELAPIQRASPFYLAGGIGLISGRYQGRDKLSGWVQGTAAYRSPIHELTPFVQVGKALTDGNEVEFLFGISHPLAPYTFHLP
ncbi:MAG: hypothetical protein ACRDHY_09495 [Anaerolineales bacterium]